MTVRIAMWSTPRSLSTALLRSFATRVDTTVVDEPFYGAWLQDQKPTHPRAQQLVRTLETDRMRVAKNLRAPCGTPLKYEKHIAHHVSVPFVAEQMQGVRHAFLIRHPARQLTSLSKVLGTFAFEISGWPMLEQLHLVFGGGAPVLDADDIGEDPARALRLLCAALSVDFSESMLAWQPGKHPAWGSWAEDWYHGVQASSGFTPPGPLPEVAPHLSAHFAAALPVYERLYAGRLR